VIVAGQTVGGLAQGLGVALGEQIVYGDDGQLLTGTLMDYPVPRADEMPPLLIEDMDFVTDHNALGVRGVGEAATGPPAAVIVNAVADAFAGQLDVQVPVLTPWRVWTLLREAGVTMSSAGRPSAPR
jgi:aerobic carbon-monoxide dehydrogenase large subunit